jgi:hypothetical protein
MRIYSFVVEHNIMGKCCTASSLRILQGLTAAKVVGCSGAMQLAYPPASLAQLARARDL